VVPAVVFALAPKCVFCGLAYVGLGTLLELAGPELCGGEIISAIHWSDWLMWGGITFALLTSLVLHQRGKTTLFRSQNNCVHSWSVDQVRVPATESKNP
jgi:hypothetical protein